MSWLSGSYIWISLQHFLNHAHACTVKLWVQGLPNSNICCKVHKIECIKLWCIVPSQGIKPWYIVASHGRHVKAFGWEYWDLVNTFFYSMNITDMVVSFKSVQVIYRFRFNICEGNEISNLRLICSIHIIVAFVHWNLVEQVLGRYEASQTSRFNTWDFTKGSSWHAFQAWRQVTVSFLNQWRNEGFQVICCWQECLWDLPYLRENIVPYYLWRDTITC